MLTRGCWHFTVPCPDDAQDGRRDPWPRSHRRQLESGAGPRSNPAEAMAVTVATRPGLQSHNIWHVHQDQRGKRRRKSPPTRPLRGTTTSCAAEAMANAGSVCRRLPRHDLRHDYQGAEITLGWQTRGAGQLARKEHLVRVGWEDLGGGEAKGNVCYKIGTKP